MEKQKLKQLKNSQDEILDEENHFGQQIYQSNIHTRLDRLPLSKWHIQFILIVGISWILDGIQVTNISNLIGIFSKDKDNNYSACGSVYILGCVLGSMFFGILSDQYGRKRIFSITPAVYAIGTLLTSLSHNFSEIVTSVFITGFGIGGEYSAISSVLDEFNPARYRGQINITVNGSY